VDKIARLRCTAFSSIVLFSSLVAMDRPRCVNKRLLELVKEEPLSFSDIQRSIAVFGDGIVHQRCHLTGNTPLHHLILRKDSTPELINLLLEHGACVDDENNDGENPFDFFFSYKGLTPSEESADFKLGPTFYRFFECYITKKLLLLQEQRLEK